METLEKDGQHKGVSEHDLTLEIQSTRGVRSLIFARTAKVQEVIVEAIKAFGFNAADSFQLTLASNPGEPLDPHRPLVSYHLSDGTKVILTAVGGGV